MKWIIFLLLFVSSWDLAFSADKKRDWYFSVSREGFQEAEKAFHSSGQKVFYKGNGASASLGKVLTRYKDYFLLGEVFASYTGERGSEAIDKETNSHAELGIKLRGGYSRIPIMKVVTGVSSMYFDRASARYDLGIHFGLELSFNHMWLKDFWTLWSNSFRANELNKDRDVSSPPYEVFLDFSGIQPIFEASRAGTSYHFGVRYYF